MAHVAATSSNARAGAGLSFFEAEAARVARLCQTLAEHFVGGGRLLAVGGSPQAWSDAHHVAVEFVHPGVERMLVSARTGEGIGAWRDWLLRAAAREPAIA